MLSSSRKAEAEALVRRCQSLPPLRLDPQCPRRDQCLLLVVGFPLEARRRASVRLRREGLPVCPLLACYLPESAEAAQ
jgi:hypothetical protein